MLKRQIKTPDDGEVVDEDSKVKFAALGLRAPSSQGGAEAAFVLAETALYLPPLAVALGGKVQSHQAPPVTLWQFARAPAASGRNYCLCAELFANEQVVGLAVVAGVGQKFIKGLRLEGLTDRFFEFDVVGQGADVGER